MRLLISMVFVGMLALSSQAFAARYDGETSNLILAYGEIIASKWEGERHLTRVRYKKVYYACETRHPHGYNDWVMFIRCWDFKPRANQ